MSAPTKCFKCEQLKHEIEFLRMALAQAKLAQQPQFKFSKPKLPAIANLQQNSQPVTSQSRQATARSKGDFFC